MEKPQNQNSFSRPLGIISNEMSKFRTSANSSEQVSRDDEIKRLRSQLFGESNRLRDAKRRVVEKDLALQELQAKLTASEQMHTVVVSGKEKEIALFKRKLSEIEGEIEEQQKELYALLEKGLQTQMQTFQKSMEEQQQRSRMTQQEREELQRTIQKLTTALASASGESQAFKSQLVSLRDENVVLSSRVDDLQTEVGKNKHLASESEKEKPQLLQKISSLETEIQQLKDTKGVLEVHIGDLEQELQKRQHVKSCADVDVKVYKEKILTLEGKQLSSDKQITNLQQQITKLASEKESLQKLLSTKESTLAQELAFYKRKTFEIEAEIEEQQKELYGLLENGLQTQMQTFQKSMEDQLQRSRNAQQEKNDLQKSVTDLMSSVSSSKEEIQGLKAQLAALKEQKKSLERQFSNATKAQEKEQSALQQKIAHLQTDVRDAVAAKEALRAYVGSLEVELSGLKASGASTAETAPLLQETLEGAMIPVDVVTAAPLEESTPPDTASEALPATTTAILGNQKKPKRQPKRKRDLQNNNVSPSSNEAEIVVTSLLSSAPVKETTTVATVAAAPTETTPAPSTGEEPAPRTNKSKKLKRTVSFSEQPPLAYDPAGVAATTPGASEEVYQPPDAASSSVATSSSAANAPANPPPTHSLDVATEAVAVDTSNLSKGSVGDEKFEVMQEYVKLWGKQGRIPREVYRAPRKLRSRILTE